MKVHRLSLFLAFFAGIYSGFAQTSSLDPSRLFSPVAVLTEWPSNVFYFQQGMDFFHSGDDRGALIHIRLDSVCPKPKNMSENTFRKVELGPSEFLVRCKKRDQPSVYGILAEGEGYYILGPAKSGGQIIPSLLYLLPTQANKIIDVEKMFLFSIRKSMAARFEEFQLGDIHHLTSASLKDMICLLDTQ